MKAVLDSSILVSAFLTPGGTPARLLAHARRGAFSLCASPDILKETTRALLRPKHRERYDYTAEDVQRFRRLLTGVAAIVRDVPEIGSVVRDPADDKILACAVEAGAAYLVTGDQDLLSLGSYEAIRIVTPRQFLEALSMEER